MSPPSDYFPSIPDYWAVDPYAPRFTIKPAILRWEYVQVIQEYRILSPDAREGLEMDKRELKWRRQDREPPYR